MYSFESPYYYYDKLKIERKLYLADHHSWAGTDDEAISKESPYKNGNYLKLTIFIISSKKYFFRNFEKFIIYKDEMKCL